MSDEAQIKTLISEADNIEYIRDEIAAILALELDNQYSLAAAAKDKNARDYKIGVYVENDDPIQFVNEGSNPFPLVNVSVDNTVPTSGSSSINKKNMTATIVIDIYATGNTNGTEDAGFRASLKAWKTARIVRNILNAEAYTYLNMRGVVSGRDFEKFQAGEPANKNAAIRVKIVQCILIVAYKEDVEIDDGVALEQDRVSVSDDNGQVIINI